MAKENNYNFLMIAMVAIVAIVGLVVIFLQKGAGTSVMTIPVTMPATEETVEGSGLVDAPVAEDNLAGEAKAKLKINTTCTDSDGGMIYYVKGYVYGRNAANKPYNFSDSCISSKILKEYYCSGFLPASVVHNCSINITSGNCTNRRCTV